MGGKNDPLVIMQVTKLRPYGQMLYEQTKICLGDEIHKSLWYTERKMNPPTRARRLNLLLVNKETRTCRLLDISVSMSHRIKVKKVKSKRNTKTLLESCKGYDT